MDKHDISNSITARNREHQRNFRARRQHYVQELEQKVRAFEQSQLQTAQTVEAAAQIVVSENQILRRLLQARLGMSDEDINNYVMDERKGQQNSKSILNWQQGPPPVDSQDDLSDSVIAVPSTASINTEALPPTDSVSLVSDNSLVRHDAPDPDQMHCEEAANIIMSIQTSSSIDDVRQDLGCGPHDSCKVRNAAVFQLMDARV